MAMTWEQKYRLTNGLVTLGVLAVFAAVVLLVVYGLQQSIQNDHAWQLFKVEKHCMEVARREGDVLTAVAPSGQVATTVAPDVVAYRCDHDTIVLHTD